MVKKYHPDESLKQSLDLVKPCISVRIRPEASIFPCEELPLGLWEKFNDGQKTAFLWMDNCLRCLPGHGICLWRKALLFNILSFYSR